MRSSLVCLLLAYSFFLTSCVGTVEDKNPKASKSASYGSQEISFSGVNEVVPISNDKVEVYFFPANGSPSDMTYKIYVNNSSAPIEVKGESLLLDQYGQYVYTVSGLRVNSQYSFSVGVKNAKDGSESTTNKTLFTETFANYTADFTGISKVIPASGDLGKEQVEVEWVPAVSLGTPFAPKPNDPVAYEIRYIAAEDGKPLDLNNPNNPAVKVFMNPTSLGSNPQLSQERKRTIAGLTPGKKYYFMVRAIHKGYVDYSATEPDYKVEQNNRILSVTTLADSGLFDWDNSSVKYDIPLGELALSKMDLRWDPAYGPFKNYRIYYMKVGEATEDLADVAAKPDTLDGATIDSMNALNNYAVVAPSLRSFRISGLDSYAYYKATVVACVSDACADGARLIGDEVLFRVTPELAPFSGLLEIRDPEDIAKLDEIEVRFDPPVITAGYVNKFELYCFEDYDDNNPDELLYNIVSTSGKANCNGLTRITQSPTNLSDFGNYSKIKIQGNFFNGADVVSDKTYCFGAIPVVEGTNYVKRNLSAAIIRCKVLKIKVPTKEEFPGAVQSCNVGPDNLTVAWNAPTSGIYDRYEVFWREDNGTPFRYEDALAGSYNSQDGLTATSFTVNNLLPGKKYQYAVLSYIAGATKKYSELNAGIRTCQIPLPTPRFTEWTDIFAIGPKGDGLVPKRDNSSNGNEKVYLFETLNQFGQPIEVDVTNYYSGNYTPSTEFEAQFAPISNSVNFPGVFGKKDANTAVSHMYQYSNSGIIRLAWKDVSFNSGTRTMQDFVDTFETAPLKKDRKFGYKVFRSDDNQKTWLELTSNNYPFQTLFNSGLLHPTDYSERLRPNEAPSTFKAVMFTDYSVKHAGVDGNSARARIYYYKIVPVFNGEELRFERESTNPQHIIKVTLPPENMALVHRLVANRQTCQEIGQSIDDDISRHYTCSWNGIGSRGLSTPWVPGATVYDFGSDMLIDRYELGCNFTRGDYQNSDNKFSGSNFDFIGESDSGGTFKGCLLKTASRAQDENGDEPGSGNTYTDRHHYRVGDCIGESFAHISASSSVCADNTKASMQYIFLPGLNNSMNLRTCENSNNLLSNYSDSYNSPPGKISTEVAQSEYAAVYYNRDYQSGSWGYTARSVRGGGADEGNPHRLGFSNTFGAYPSRCMINIPVSDVRPNASGGGRLKHRWIPANMLGDMVYDGNSASPINIIDKTLTEVEAMNEFFDTTANAIPSSGYRNNSAMFRYDANETPIGRIVSSNDSKLPPLNGLSHEQADSYCSTYKVEVGILNDSTSAFNAQESELSKRMMRRTEGIVASAHPKNFDDTTIIDLEKGVRTETPTGSGGVNFNGSCNSFDRGINQGQLNSTVAAGLPMSVRMADNATIRAASSTGATLISGSSFFDYEGDNFSSQSCTSRYGLQDIVGNMEEYSSERVFCNYGGEALMIGTSEQSGDSIPASNGLTYNDSNLEPWVQSDPDTGRCSFVEVGSSRSATFASGSFLIPQYDFFGNLNTAMISSVNNADEYSISYLRNGDGYFLDFGQDNLAPPVSLNDTLALVDEYPVTSRRPGGADDPRRGKYFSPIAGIPLECGDTSCATTTDNMSISTEDLRTKFSLLPGAFNVPDYPVGNSIITSDGMSEINKGNSITISTANTVSYPISYLDTINPSVTTTSQTDDPLDIVVKDVWWRVDRGSYLYFRNFGGKNRSSRPGRYTANILGKHPSVQKASTDHGVRCAVRINEGRP